VVFSSPSCAPAERAEFVTSATHSASKRVLSITQTRFEAECVALVTNSALSAGAQDGDENTTATTGSYVTETLCLKCVNSVQKSNEKPTQILVKKVLVWYQMVRQKTA
jgi:hypothetical protein